MELFELLESGMRIDLVRTVWRSSPPRLGESLHAALCAYATSPGVGPDTGGLHRDPWEPTRLLSPGHENPGHHYRGWGPRPAYLSIGNSDMRRKTRGHLFLLHPDSLCPSISLSVEDQGSALAKRGHVITSQTHNARLWS